MNNTANNTLHILAERFRDPPANCRTVPQWSWNGDISRDRISRVLRQFKEQGCGGLYMHIRPGITVDYLSEHWFELWDYAMREASKLGLGWHIYDEFTAAGGNAGGHTVAESPHAVSQELVVSPVSNLKHLAGHSDILEIYAYSEDDRKITDVELSRVGEDSSGHFLVLYCMQSGRDRKRNGIAPVDLLHPDATRTFIRTTHEKYAHWSADCFGTTVRFVFNDEPHMSNSPSTYAYNPFLAKEFFKDHGYPLEDRLGSLCFWESDSREVRYDYYSTVNRLYNMNFVKPLHDWCAQNNLEFSGHFMEHEWPFPQSQANTMASLRWLQAPGNDLLGFQFTMESPEANGIYFLNLKELGSVARQFNRRNIMVESCGGAGFEAAFDVFKPTEDYLLTFGVNVMDPHLSHYSLVGSRKYDFAQTLSDHSSWWPYYKKHADHVARVIAASADAEEYNRILVLHPTTTGWMYYQPKGYPWQDGPNWKLLSEMRETHIALLLALYQAQIDFDLGDELLMEECGAVTSSKLQVGARAYDVVVIPDFMETCKQSTLELLRAFLEAGGTVLQVGEGIRRVEARINTEPENVRNSFPENWRVCESTDELIEGITALIPPYISSPDGGSLPVELMWRRAVLPDGSILYFFCNPWKRQLRCDILLEGKRIVALNTDTGEMEPADQKLALDLPPRGHALVLSATESVPGVKEMAGSPRAGENINITFAGAKPVDLNRMIIDFCDIEANGRMLRDVNTVVADETNWRWQGWNGTPWLWSGGIKPFKANHFRTSVAHDTSFRISYRFLSGDSAIEPLYLAVERPELYEIAVNDCRLDSNLFQPWFDEGMAWAPVGGMIKSGENRIGLYTSPWNVLCEVAPVYLVGEFSIRSADRGFALESAGEAGLGDWTRMGMPFYSGEVVYSFQVDGSLPHFLRLELPDWSGSVAVVRWNGEIVGQIMHPPYILDFPTPNSEQNNTLQISIMGNMRNMMGPFFSDGPPVAAQWKRGPEHMPSGSEYKFQPSGLISMPVLRALIR